MTEAADGSDAGVAGELDALLGAGRLHRVALAGGSTPGAILPMVRGGWAGVEVWPTDERRVPPGHPHHNATALRAALPGATVRELAEGPSPGPFDLVWAGMGADGHVLSVFPRPGEGFDGPPAVIATTPDPLPPEAPHPRLTLTLAAAASAPHLWLVIRGEAKRAVLEADGLPVHRLLALAPHARVFWSPR